MQFGLKSRILVTLQTDDGRCVAFLGRTPVAEKLLAAGAYLIRIWLGDGVPTELTIERQPDGWTTNGTPLGPGVCLAVDSASGRVFGLAERQVAEHLGLDDAQLHELRDGLMVLTTPHPDPQWVPLA